MLDSLLRSFSGSNINTEVHPIEVATVLDVIPENTSRLNLSQAELHSPAMNATVFSTAKGSVSAIEFGEELILFNIAGQEKPVVLDIDTPIERVKQLILSYIQ